MKVTLETGSWPVEEVKIFMPFKAMNFHITMFETVRGNKFVVPLLLRNRMLNLAHEGHSGQVDMKRRLRDIC